MKTYPQNKFQELEPERQARIVLELISNIELQWNDFDQKSGSLKVLKNYFAWMNLHASPISFFKRLSALEFRIENDMSLRELLDLAVPLERYLDLALKDESLLPVREGDDSSAERKTFPIVLVLDHLRSAFNVGSLFRSGECLGVEHIHLVGYTPTPDDKSVQKTAMGTDQWMEWTQHDQMSDLTAELKTQNYQLVALETCKGAKTLREFVPIGPVALFAGNERFGLSQDLIQQMDAVVEIPMCGGKNSLNVANSVSVALYDLTGKMR